VCLNSKLVEMAVALRNNPHLRKAGGRLPAAIYPKNTPQIGQYVRIRRHKGTERHFSKEVGT